jgi:hypothetical protein
MHAIVNQHSNMIQILRVLVIRNESVYGVVSAQTAHSSWLLAEAYLNRASSPLNEAYTNAAAAEDAVQSSNWAQKALQITSVLFGRNHEMTFAVHVTLDMASFRIENDERVQEAKRAAEQARALETANSLISGASLGESVVFDGTEGSSTSKVESEFTPTALIETEKEMQLQCPVCASVFFLAANSRIVACSNCGQFCTELHRFKKPSPNDKPVAEDPFSVVLSKIVSDYESTNTNFHVAGEMLPNELAQFSTSGTSSVRAVTATKRFYDGQMRQAITQIVAKHNYEWQPCSVCSKERAAKQ